MSLKRKSDCQQETQRELQKKEVEEPQEKEHTKRTKQNGKTVPEWRKTLIDIIGQELYDKKLTEAGPINWSKWDKRVQEYAKSCVIEKNNLTHWHGVLVSYFIQVHVKRDEGSHELQVLLDILGSSHKHFPDPTTKYPALEYAVEFINKFDMESMGLVRKVKFWLMMDRRFLKCDARTGEVALMFYSVKQDIDADFANLVKITKLYLES